jgi:mannan endo-1,4-beta-mannosidase
MGKQSEQVMKKYLLPVWFILLLIFPVDASAGSKTRAQVLSYLTSLPSQSNKKILSGQRTGYLNDGKNGLGRWGNDIFGDIATNSGGYVPAIMGAEIDRWRAVAYGLCTEPCPYNLTRLINHWNAGGLIEIDWIATNPYNNIYVWPEDNLGIDVATVYTPGNTSYNNFRTSMDYVAAALHQLQDNGVIVLFRPLPEMNQNEGPNPQYPPNDWWGGKEPYKYAILWRYMYDYFTNTKGLTNLIWVYSVVPYFEDQVFDYYPGDAYVDIVGADYYSQRNDGVIGWDYLYTSLRTKGKPFAFTEYGPSNASCSGDNWGACAGKNASSFINGVKSNFPDTVYWMNWDDGWQLGFMANLPSLFADPWVVNRADNPSGATGVPALAISSGTPLPSGQQNVLYTLTLSATGGTSPYTWSLLSGNLPEGMSLSSSGVISGTPTAGAVGTSSFGIQVTASGYTATKAFSVEMVPVASGQSKKPSSPAGVSIR